MLPSFAGLKRLFKTLLTLQRDTNPTISIITWNANGLNAPLRQRLWSGSKKKTQLYVIYKKGTLNINAHRDDVEQQETPFIAGGNAKCTATLGDSVAVSYKTKQTFTMRCGN